MVRQSKEGGVLAAQKVMGGSKARKPVRNLD